MLLLYQAGFLPALLVSTTTGGVLAPELESIYHPYLWVLNAGGRSPIRVRFFSPKQLRNHEDTFPPRWR
jgi:hypothetical protein